MTHKSSLICTVIVFLLMTALSQAADLSGLDNLNAFAEACTRAEKASEAASLRQAINSIQKLKVELGMSDTLSSHNNTYVFGSRFLPEFRNYFHLFFAPPQVSSLLPPTSRSTAQSVTKTAGCS
jgi:hypothetical protein